MQKRLILILSFFFCASLLAQPLDISAWAYQLQNIDLSEIAAASDFDLIVIDYSSDGSESGEWSYAQIAAVRTSGKKVISYISIGEAEDYRWYWNPAWESSPPVWLGPENPDWAGNYKVRFWYAEWQNIILSYLDRIVAQGFDGAYLDIVDAYYYWMVDNPEQPFADTLMIHFIERINHYCDSVTVHNFYVFPQNAESIIDEINVTPALGERYFAAIDAIGIEDVFFYGDEDENNPLNPDEYRIGILDSFVARGKKVCSIEYLTLPALIEVYLDSAFAHDFYPYATRRALDTLYGAFPHGIDQSTPRQYVLRLDAYPNPFNDACIIRVSGSGYRVASIEIHDLRGNRIAEFQSDTRHPFPDTRTIIWCPNKSIVSGIYLVRATMQDGQTIGRKILYMK